MMFLHFLLPFFGALVLIPVLKRVATKTGCVARPKEDRWHKKPTPLLGGVAIAVVVIVDGLVASPTEGLRLILAGGAAIALLGLVDDVVRLKSSTKLVAEIVVAAVFVYAGYRLHWTRSLTLDAILTLVWIVGITNALNLLDNMDGLCAGVGVISAMALLLALNAGSEATLPERELLVAMVGALTAFLVFNRPPASIFMGDTGSLFIGLTLATVAVETSGSGGASSGLLSIVAAPVLVLLIPIFDTTLVTVLRLLSGRSPAQGGRDHSSHRLVAMGLSEFSAVAVLWTLAAIAGLIGASVRWLGVDWAGMMAATFVLALVIFAVYLARVRVYDDTEIQPAAMTPVIIDFMHKRRFAEVALDFCLVCVAYYAAYRLRFEAAVFSTFFPTFLRTLPVVIAVQLASLFLVGAYRGMWRYFGLMDAVVFAKGVALGTAVVIIGLRYLDRGEPSSVAAVVIYAALLMLLLMGSRASFRLITEYIRRRVSGARIVIYGADPDEQLVAHELLAQRGGQVRMVGFASDAPDALGGRVRGHAVLGGYDELLEYVAGGLIDQVIVCVRGIEEERLDELAQHCHAHRVALSLFRYSLEPVPRN
jgi:UDP-GlcNAc:undecaprenyl-phosphate GlcNAc-1-phosphate transferase